MNNIYELSLNKFCQLYMLTDKNRINQSGKLRARYLLGELKANLFENFLLYDKTTFKVYGANCPLALLVNILSFKEIEKLIEQDSMNFALWNRTILQANFGKGNIIPIAPAHVGTSGDMYNDPEKSIYESFNFFLKKPSKKEKDILIRKVRDLYIIPQENIESDVHDIIISAFNSNKLSKFGLDPLTSDLYDLNEEKKSTLFRCANSLLEYKFSLDKNLTPSKSDDFSSFFIDSTEKISNLDLKSIFSNIAKIQSFPDLKSLSYELNDPLSEISDLRSTRNAKKFRNFLNNLPDHTNIEEITTSYINAIANSKGFFETKKGRFIKTISMSSIGAAVGSLGGSIGMTVGGILGQCISPAMDTGLDLLDEFFLTELSKGWTPKMFFDDLEKIRSQKSSS